MQRFIYRIFIQVFLSIFPPVKIPEISEGEQVYDSRCNCTFFRFSFIFCLVYFALDEIPEKNLLYDSWCNIWFMGFSFPFFLVYLAPVEIPEDKTDIWVRVQHFGFRIFSHILLVILRSGWNSGDFRRKTDIWFGVQNFIFPIFLLRDWGDQPEAFPEELKKEVRDALKFSLFSNKTTCRSD